jgi:hypothetical protein
MSRSRSRRRSRKDTFIIPRKVLPLLVVAAGVLVIGVAILVITTAGGAADPNFAPQVTGAPKLVVDQPFYDLGDFHFNTMAEVTYTLSNVGDQPLRILELPQVQVLEGC